MSTFLLLNELLNFNKMEQELLVHIQQMRSAFSAQNFVSDDKKFNYWTELASYSLFKSLLSFLVPGDPQTFINYVDVSPSYLPIKDQFFLF